MKENDPTTFKVKLIKKCPWYYGDFLEIFMDRASAHHLVINHDGTNLLEESLSKFEFLLALLSLLQ